MYIRDQTYRALGESAGPFEGTFTGTVTGDSKTTATITAQLTHQGTKIKGNVLLGRGLRLGFGPLCGEEDVDLTQIPIDTGLDPINPLRFTTTTQVDEPTTQKGLAFIRMNVTITAELTSDPSHRTINAKVTLKPHKGLNADRSENWKPIPCSEKHFPFSCSGSKQPVSAIAWNEAQGVGAGIRTAAIPRPTTRQAPAPIPKLLKEFHM